MADAPRVTRTVREIAPGDGLDLDALLTMNEPVVARGFAADWPLVQAGLASPAAAADYLRRFDAGRAVTGYVGAPAIRGRFHYNDSATAMNFATERMTLDAFLGRVLAQPGEDASSLYLGSTDLDTYLPSFRSENELRIAGNTFTRHPPLASIWIGNRTIASAHYDQSNNAAVCAVGHRRFTLFPPEQVANLYPGPLAPTPGGQVVSMVDFAAPDLSRFPRLADALAAGQVAELGPGDVLVFPALWWHHVEALDAFNVLVNYWWNAAPAFMDTPMDTLLHAFLSLRDRPVQEKAAWRAMFDHYVFGDADAVAAHLPAGARGPLSPLDEGMARQLRAYLLGRLNR